MSSSLETPQSTYVPPAILPGVATGAGSALAAIGAYQLFRMGFWLAQQTTVQSGATAPVGTRLDQFIGLELLPSLLSLGPTVVGGGLLGGFVGLVITQTWHRQSAVKAALTGGLITAFAAVIANLTLIVRTRKTVLTYDHWKGVAGYPSVIFVLVFAAVGAWLYVSRARAARGE